MAVFVGEERLRQLTELTGWWDRALDQQELRIAVVRGPGRSGKTELLRRLYGHCALSQVYWPRELSAADGLYPREFRIKRPTAIPYLWWAMDPHPDGFVLLEAAPQVTAHLDSLRDAVARADELVKLRLRASLNAAFMVGSLLPLGNVASTVMNLVDAGTSGTVQQVWDAFTPQETVVANARSAKAGRTISVDGPSAAHSAAESEGIAHARLAQIVPYAVVVDHAERLDRHTITVLKSLARHGGVGLIVLAVDTDQEHSADPYAGNAALADWLGEEDRLETTHHLALQPLTDDETITLAKEQLASHGIQMAKVERERLAAAIIAADGRPGRLIDLLTVWRVRAALVTPEEQTLPDLTEITRSQVITEQLAALPEQQQALLCTLALFGPVAPRAWLPEEINDTDFDELDGTWLRHIDVSGIPGGTVGFASRELWHACNYFEDSPVTDAAEDRALHRLSAEISDARWTGSWAQLDPGLAESLLVAVLDGLGVEDMPPDQLIELNRIRRLTGRSDATNRLVDRIVERFDDPHPPLHQVVATAEALWDAGQTQEVLRVLQADYDEAVAKHGENAAATIPALANLASTWNAIARERMGQPDALAYYRHAVTLYEKLIQLRTLHLPSHDRRIPDTCQDLTALHHLFEQFEAAIAQGNQAAHLYSHRACLGPDHPQTLISRNNLARAYELAGDLKRAIPLYEQTATDRERVLGPDHPATLVSRNNLAGAYLAASDLDRAIPLYEQTLADCERVLGPDHPETLVSRNNLAGAYLAASDLERAIPLLERNLTARERVLGPRHAYTLASRDNLAYAYLAAGDLDRAVPLYEQGCTDHEQILGPVHPETMVSRNNLASAYQSAGDLGRAIRLHEKNLTDRLRVLGPDHPGTLTSRNNLAHAYLSAGDLDRAVPLLELTFAEKLRVLGPDHPDTMASKTNLEAVRRELDESPE